MFGHDDRHAQNDNTAAVAEPTPDGALVHGDEQPSGAPVAAASAPTVPDTDAGSYLADDGAGTASADDTVVPAPPAPPAAPAAPAAAAAPAQPAASASAPASTSTDNEDLLGIKQQALQQLTPLVGHLDQTPEEKFRTTMMMIQAADNDALIKDAYTAAQAITDEKARAQALLDIVNEINYFTQAPAAGEQPSQQ